MTSDVMQAAKRLRREDAYVIIERTGSDVTGQDFDHGAFDRDRQTLAEFALQLLPKEDRPAAIADCDLTHGQIVWIIVGSPVRVRVRKPGTYATLEALDARAAWEVPTVKSYPTEAAAKLALHHDLIDRLVALSSQQSAIE